MSLSESISSPWVSSPTPHTVTDREVSSPTPQSVTVREVSSPTHQTVTDSDVPSSSLQTVTGNDISSTPSQVGTGIGVSSLTKTSNRPRNYMTKFKKNKEKLQKKSVHEKAIADMHRGKFKSLRRCAAFHKLSLTTLHRLLLSGDQYEGSGPKLDCLSLEEESVILRHVKWRSQIGCGVDFGQLQSLVQESLLALKSANPDRRTGYEATGQLPNKDFVRRMVARNNLSLRRTAEISKGIINLIFSLYQTISNCRETGLDCVRPEILAKRYRDILVF